MDGTEITLQDMLSCREARMNRQNELLSKYQLPLLSFCMNIPGPIKTNARIRSAFERGKEEIKEQIRRHSWNIITEQLFHAPTGDELLLVVNAPAWELKESAAIIEEQSPLGRLYDIDILDASGRKLSRPVCRKCLLCGRQAQVCARARSHSVSQLQKRVEELLRV